jgi:hypothetical protein
MKRARTSRILALVLRTIVFAIACAVIVSAWPCSLFHDVALIEDGSDERIFAHLICAPLSVWNFAGLYPGGGSNPQNILAYVTDFVSVPILFLLI